MASADSYTLLIPTYNRPDLLARLLRYLGHSAFPHPIQVLDSSGEVALARNAATCAASGLRIRHRTFPGDIAVDRKWLEGIREVETPYVSYCADDDFVLAEALANCLRFLEAHPDHIACHGHYINFQAPGQYRTEYSGPSQAGATALQRLWQWMRNYEAITYAVFRTETYRYALEANVNLVFENMYKELLVGALPLVDGKVHRLDQVYYARNGGSGDAESNRRKWHPLVYLLDDSEELFREFHRYREAILTRLRAREGGFDEARAVHHLNLIHCVYFVYSLDLNQVEQAITRELGADMGAFAGSAPGDIGRTTHLDPRDLGRAGLELDVYYGGL